jgi:hypothetical protein
LGSARDTGDRPREQRGIVPDKVRRLRTVPHGSRRFPRHRISAPLRREMRD